MINRAVGASVTLAMALACTPVPASTPPSPNPTPATSTTAPIAATDTAGLPAGLGSLGQDEVSVKMSLRTTEAYLIPLDEAVLRTLSPDTYRSLHGVVDAYKREIDAKAREYQLRERRAWQVTFFGRSPDARFTPTDLTIGQTGREYRPVTIIPLTHGFGEGRVQPREAQRAIYLFEDGLNVMQPLRIRMETETNTTWETIVRRIEKEIAYIRSRR